MLKGLLEKNKKSKCEKVKEINVDPLRKYMVCWPGFTTNDLQSNDKIMIRLLVFMGNPVILTVENEWESVRVELKRSVSFSRQTK